MSSTILTCFQNSLCGYQIRMETKAGDSTRLLYCTTGVLLRKLQQDGLLDRVSHVIVDEVGKKQVHLEVKLCINDVSSYLVDPTFQHTKGLLDHPAFNFCPILV